jgi:hypothetical protein
MSFKRFFGRFNSSEFLPTTWRISATGERGREENWFSWILLSLSRILISGEKWFPWGLFLLLFWIKKIMFSL